MSKKITIKEQDVEEPAEETREEIVEQLNAPAPSSPEPSTPAATAAPAEPPQQKADCKMRMRELYKCDGCGKYLTKKSLNYSHQRTCKGNPANQIAKPQKEEPPEPPAEAPIPQPPPQQYIPPPMPLYEQMRLERRRAHIEKINRLAQFIV